MKRLAWALLLLAACSPAPLDLEDFDTASLSSLCLRAVRCGLQSSYDACQAYFRKPPPSSFGPARAAGHLDYDGDQARRCQDALAAQSCDLTSRDYRVVPPACRAMFRGKIADGDACSFDQQCASGRCDQGVCPEGVCCVGVCGVTRSGGKVGDPCDRSAECVDGFCDADHTCHALGAANTMCARDEQCDYGLACIAPSPSVPGDCKALPHLGEACPYLRCAEQGAICDASGHCVPIGLPGAACTSPADCSPFLECDRAQGKCIDLPTLGMPCDFSCAGEAFCDFQGQALGTCAAPTANGTPCEDAGTCANRNCKPGPVFDSCQDYPVCP